MSKLEKGHKRDAERKVVRYTVWNNYTDQLIAVDETGPRCAELMGMKYNSFQPILSRGKSRKWTIQKRYTDEPESEDEE